MGWHLAQDFIYRRPLVGGVGRLLKRELQPPRTAESVVLRPFSARPHLANPTLDGHLNEISRWCPLNPRAV